MCILEKVLELGRVFSVDESETRQSKVPRCVPGPGWTMCILKEVLELKRDFSVDEFEPSGAAPSAAVRSGADRSKS